MHGFVKGTAYNKTESFSISIFAGPITNVCLLLATLLGQDALATCSNMPKPPTARKPGRRVPGTWPGTQASPPGASRLTLGGRSLSARELLSGYEQLASVCLTTAFILSPAKPPSAGCVPARDSPAPAFPAWPRSRRPVCHGWPLPTDYLAPAPCSRAAGHTGWPRSQSRSLSAPGRCSLGDRRRPCRPGDHWGRAARPHRYCSFCWPISPA